MAHHRVGLRGSAAARPPAAGHRPSSPSTGRRGRRPRRRSLGATHARLAVTDLAGAPLSERAYDTDIARPPEQILVWVNERFTDAAERGGQDAARTSRHRRRRARRRSPSRARRCAPPMMPGWDGSRSRTGSPSTTTRRCSSTTTSTSWRWVSTGPTGAMRAPALREGRHGHRLRDHLGQPHPPRRAGRGRGHRPRAARAGTRTCVCRCGNLGCLEAVAGGRALARAARERRAGGQDARATSCGLVRERRARARRRPCATPAAPSARCSPSASTSSTRGDRDRRRRSVGGRTSSCSRACARSSFGRSLPMATRDLRIGHSQLGDRAGVIGAAIMVIEHVLAPADRRPDRPGRVMSAPARTAASPAV